MPRSCQHCRIDAPNAGPCVPGKRHEFVERTITDYRGIVTLESLLMAGEVYNIQPGVVRRMREVFGMQVIQAVNEGDAELAVEYYHEAAKLPQTKTENVFLEEGISMSSGKFFNLGVLNICFRSFKPYILKTLTEKELGRGEKFLESMGSYEYWQHYITEFDILANKFILMPYYAATLVSIKRFDAKESSILMSQIGSALVFLHSRGFCFMDVKPSNICLAGDGSLVLIDLGSIAQIDTYTEVTTVYLPKDLQNEFICFSRSNRYQSSPLYDWWMLLVTLLEKSMDVEIGGLLPTPSRSDILERLSSASQIQVQREVLSELRQVIPTEMPFFQEPTEDTMPVVAARPSQLTFTPSLKTRLSSSKALSEVPPSTG